MKLCKEDIQELIKNGLTQAQIAKEKGIPVRKVTVFCSYQGIKNPNTSERLLLSNQEEQVIIGSLLGDGTVTSDGRLRIKHSTRQLKYLEYKASLLKNVNYNFVDSKTHYDKRTNKIYTACCLDSKVYQNFRNYRKDWYPNSKKRIFINDFSKIEPLGIAIWFMDDGFKYNSKSIMIATDSFDLEDLETCCKMLKDKFKLNFRISRRNRIYLSRIDYSRFFILVRPYIHESMLYKLPPI